MAGGLDRGAAARDVVAARGPGEPLPDDRDDARGPEADVPGLTVGRLAARHGLSRSTLLYYDRIGLLTPSARSAAGYRRYDAADDARLATICRYRRAGISLEAIHALLDAPRRALTDALAERLVELDEQIRTLREQQRFILGSLSGGRPLDAAPFLGGEQLVALLDRTGVDADRRAAWHAALERTDGDLHQAFLEFLCMPDDEIRRIREGARGAGQDHASGT